MTKVLTPSQKYDLISQYAEICVDSMDLECLMQIAEDHVIEYCEKLILSELKDEIDNHDEELWDELVDNVTSNPTPLINNQGG